MSWRTIVITTRCKIDYKMGYMVIRGDETKKIFLDEVALLIIENPAVSLTGCLLEVLVEKKIKLIFCDKTHSPIGELVNYHDSFESTRRIKEQISWKNNVKALVWTDIIREKITKQAQFLRDIDKVKESEMLFSYINELQVNDVTNREGHSAKVYFNGVFGMNFTRSAICAINSALNYGYSIILSAFNREISCCGYLTQLGIFHDNVHNYFNLSCDLMEPFRILVDRYVYFSNFQKFESDEKHNILNLLSKTVIIDNSNQTILNAIKIYVRSVINALNSGDISLIKFYKG